MRALFKEPKDEKFRTLVIPNKLKVLQQLVGPILIVGVDGDEFTDCPMSVTMANTAIVG